MTFFHYIHKKTIIHQMDGRLKLLCMLLLTISASMASKWHHYLVLLSVIGLSLMLSKLPFITILKEMKFFAIIIAIVLIMNSWLFAGRLILMLLISIVIAGTTSLQTLSNAIEWYLRPIPFVPASRIAMIIKLTFALIPMIFDHYLEMTHAQKARCIQLNKKPIRRVKLIVFPLLTRTLRQADSLICAMESRSYSEVRTKPTFKINKEDWLILLVCLVVSLIIFFK